MLLVESRTLLALRRETRAVLGDLALSVSGATNIGDGRSARVWALSTVGDATQEIGRRTSRAVLSARRDARQTALVRVKAECGASVEPSDAAEDVGLAEIAGSSYAAAWGAAMMREVLAWADDPSGTPKLKAASDSQDYRLARIAATEVAQAYNDEHGEAARSLRAPGLMKRWEAILDRRVCKTCRALDGQTVPVSGVFAKGLEPGFVHPVCRCIEVVLGDAMRVSTDDAVMGGTTTRRAMTSEANAPSRYVGGGGSGGGGGSTDDW